VTIPHKEQALELADQASERARMIGAANTLVFDAGGTVAENTDAPALISALPFSPAGRTALVLGAGGSARAAVWALLDAGASAVRVWNRTPDRARQLCADLGGDPVASAGAADLLINCTSVGLTASASPFELLPVTARDLSRFNCVVDFVYAAEDTALVQAARAQSLPVVDGLALLVGQGALSFELFTGRAAPIDVMHAALCGE
jgi:shikimate dehydrogenase